MKYYILKALVQYLNRFEYIKYIKRVDNNILKIEFNSQEIIYFDMTKGDATVYINDDNPSFKKDFKAPFDMVLQKRFTSSNIDKIYLQNDDKILNIEVISKSKYKKEKVTISFEFTGKNTNIIIFNEDNIIVEALRHLDEYTTLRVIKVGIKLEPLQKPNFVFEKKECKDIKQILKNIYVDKQERLLNGIKKQKIDQLLKQKQKINNILNSLDNIDILKIKSDELYHKGNLILSNINKIKPYDKKIDIKDFDGNNIELILDKKYPTPSSYANHLFKMAKKYKQKISFQYIEQNNLLLKLSFYNRMIKIIKEQTTIDGIEFYIPKKDKKKIKTKKSQPYASFFIDGYKIMLGRDERENIYLLHNSKASDFWFHLQGEVSAHVIVVNSKKELPRHIIEEASKLCVKFSKDMIGNFVVDYTQRRNVKIQSRANVLYNPYNSLVVKI